MNDVRSEPAPRPEPDSSVGSSLRRELATFESEAETLRKLETLNPAPPTRPARTGVPWWVFFASHLVVSSAVVFGPKPVGWTVLGLAGVGLIVKLIASAVGSSDPAAEAQATATAVAAAAQLPALDLEEALKTYLAGFRKHTEMLMFPDQKVVLFREDGWSYDKPRSCYVRLTDESYVFCQQHADTASLKELRETYRSLRDLGKLGPPR